MMTRNNEEGGGEDDLPITLHDYHEEYLNALMQRQEWEQQANKWKKQAQTNAHTIKQMSSRIAALETIIKQMEEERANIIEALRTLIASTIDDTTML
jgi:hypothetical protein